AGEIGDRVLDLRLQHHLLALEDAAEQQADDHQHDGYLHQGEAAVCVHPAYPGLALKSRFIAVVSAAAGAAALASPVSLSRSRINAARSGTWRARVLSRMRTGRSVNVGSG